MEDIKTIRLKDLFFYLFISWRGILVSMLILALLAGGLTFLRPAPMVPVPRASEAPKISVPEKYLPTLPSYDFNIEYPENPREYFSEAEIQSMKKSMLQQFFVPLNVGSSPFTISSAQAGKLQTKIDQLEQENADLEEKLAEDPYLQIDPEARINKQFHLTLTLGDDERDKETQAFLQQQLVNEYRDFLESDRFAALLAERMDSSATSAELSRLLEIHVESSDSILVKGTAAEAELRENLFQSCIRTLRDLFLEKAVSAFSHKLNIEVEKDEKVKDPAILAERKKIGKQIAENEAEIRQLQELIEERSEEIFLEEYQLKAQAENDKTRREKQEVIQALSNELAAWQFPAEDIQEIVNALQDSGWHKSGIGKILGYFVNALDYDTREAEKLAIAMDEKQDLFPAAHALQHLLMKRVNDQTHQQGEEIEDEEVEMIPARKSYKRNIAIGLMLGMVLGAFIAILRYWQDLAAYDIPTLTAAQKLPYIGKISVKHPKSRKRFGDAIDRLIICAFGYRYQEEEQKMDLQYTAQYLQGVASAQDERPTVLVPIAHRNPMKSALFQELQNTVREKGYSFLLRETGSLRNTPQAIEDLQNSQAVLLIRDGSEALDEISQEPQIAHTYKKPIWGVLEISKKW